MPAFNPINVGKTLFRRARQGLRQVRRMAGKTRPLTSTRKPKLIQVDRASKGNNWFPRFNITPVPRRHNAILNYTSTNILSGGVSGIAGGTIEFGLNCLFDPFLGVGGHQPMGFDQLTPLFQRYKVHKVDFKVRAMGTAGVPWVCAQVTGSQTVSPKVAGATFGELNERSACAVSVVDVARGDGSIIYGTFNIKDIEGQSTADDNYSGGANGNPSNIPKLVVAIGDINDGDSSEARVIVELVFHCTFYNKQILDQS